MTQQMTAIPDKTAADPQQIIADLERKLDDRTSERDEALERQTATADILQIIASSPSDVQPVFDAVADRAMRLLDCWSVIVTRFDGEYFQFGAARGALPDTEQFVRQRYQSMRPDPGSLLGRCLLGRTVVSSADALAEPDPQLRDYARKRGLRAVLIVPLLRDDRMEGALVLTRAEPGLFAPREIELVQTFADQAVIAIQNARLFDEVQARTRDLTEALTYQTGSSNILKVIASSPTDVGPVLKAIVENACELCEAYDAIVVLKDGGDLVSRAHHGPIPMNEARWPNDRNAVSGRAVADRLPVHLGDALSDEGAEFPTAQEMARLNGFRSILGVPMIRNDEAIGAILLRRTEVHPFSDKQISLLQTFADQAVIAIGNVRLFEEVQAKTRELSEALVYQTGSGNILRVIASSPTNIGPVLKAIVENACELCDAYDAIVRLKEGNQLHASAHHGPVPTTTDKWLISRYSATGRAVLDKKPVHVHDMLSAEGDEFPESQARVRHLGYRTLLSVPLLREGESIGAIVLRRNEVQPFSDKQIALLQTFADQVVIAIGNVRMFEQVQAKTRELSQSLEDLRAAQDRLVQTEKLASLGQLTAGIAHEIKNPLNFVNNFSALSAELIDELDETLAPAPLDQKMRGDVGELTQMLKSDLEKVAQHGKRADSIVKNMLLHSREGSGEHRSADINALVEESLNLAYHGARAEKSGFNVTLQRDLDPDAGAVELYPPEITRALLNLISNGFYAATQRRSVEGETFGPVLIAATKNLGKTVEIRIRDNGTGIRSEVKEKMYNPFFTTKPAGEGTGLGLSMSHDIIVKQHGGTIDVETEPGQFTEFRIVLPRMSSASKEK
jgi:two-component system NtrC family sensor kinase